MASDDAVRRSTRKVRPRAKRPRSKAFPGTKHLFTATVAGYPVPIFTSKSLIEGNAVGMWDPETHELAILLPAPSAIAEADRLLHEVLHAISTISLTEDSRLTEVQVNTLSTVLVDMLTRNEDLREFLLQRIAPTESVCLRRALSDLIPASVVDDVDPDTAPAPTRS